MNDEQSIGRGLGSHLSGSKEFAQSDFVILSWLAAGNTADIFLVRNEERNYVCVAKIASADLLSDREKSARFMREIECHRIIGGRAGIVPLIGFGRKFSPAIPRPFLVLPKAFPASDVLHRVWSKGVAPPLEYVQGVLIGHGSLVKQNMLHRDIKVENSLIGTDSFGMVADFGRAVNLSFKFTAEDFAFGDPRFAAPQTLLLREQVTELELEHIESVGLIYLLLEMVTGLPVGSALIADPVGTTNRAKLMEASDRVGSLESIFPDYLSGLLALIRLLPSELVGRRAADFMLDVVRAGPGHYSRSHVLDAALQFIDDGQINTSQTGSSNGSTRAGIVSTTRSKSSFPAYVSSAASDCERWPDSAVAWVRFAQAASAIGEIAIRTRAASNARGMAAMGPEWQKKLVGWATRTY